MLIGELPIVGGSCDSCVVIQSGVKDPAAAHGRPMTLIEVSSISTQQSEISIPTPHRMAS
jgi:hypothetical protein